MYIENLSIHELVEYAAKAAGYSFEFENDCFMIESNYKGYVNYDEWNPYLSDGDAFRLAVDLNILTYQCYDNNSYASTPYNETFIIPHYGDSRQSTRMAIIKAAASMYKEIPE